MDKDGFTAAVLAAEPTLYRVAKTMLRTNRIARTRHSRLSCTHGSGCIRCEVRSISKHG